MILEKKDAEVTAAGFKGHMGGKAHGIGYVEGGAPTIVAGQETHVVICFEPGISKRDGSEGRFVTDKSTTLRANMGDNLPAVCYKIGAFMGGQGPKARTIAYSEKVSPTIKNSPSGGNTIPDVVYPINTMVAVRGGKDDMRTCFGIGEPGDPQFTISAAHSHAVAYCIHGGGSVTKGRIADATRIRRSHCRPEDQMTTISRMCATRFKAISLTGMSA